MLYDKGESFFASSFSHYCTFEKLSIPITNHTDQLPISQIELTTNVGSHQISYLQTREIIANMGTKMMIRFLS